MTREQVAKPEVERYVLGIALLDPAALDEIAAALRPDDFAIDANARTFAAILALREQGAPVENVALAEELDRRGDLDRVGGVGYVASLSDGSVSIDPSHYVETLRGYSRRRKVAAWAAQLQRVSLDPEATAADLDSALERPDGDSGSTRSIQAFGGVVRARLGEVERLASSPPGEAVGFATDLADLDHATTGIRPGELWIIGAIPGTGKTALLGQIAHANASGGVGVGVCSLEMSADSLADRFAALATGIHLRKFREPRLLTPTEHANLIEARDALAALPLAIDDTPGMALGELRARARLMQRRHGVRLILVDYLQLVKGPGEARREQVGAVARGLKDLARELGVGVVAASQLARPQRGGPATPTMLDLKESGEIEAAADVVLLIHRPFILSQRPEDRGDERIIIGKNRHGTVGGFDVVFDGAHCRFRAADRRAA